MNDHIPQTHIPKLLEAIQAITSIRPHPIRHIHITCDTIPTLDNPQGGPVPSVIADISFAEHVEGIGTITKEAITLCRAVSSFAP